MALGCNSFLRDENLSTDGAVLALCQAWLRAGRSDRFINDFCVRLAFNRDSACLCLDRNRVQIIVNKIFTVRCNRNGIVPCFLRRLECQHHNDAVSFSCTIQTVPNNADRVVVQFSRLCHCQSCKSLTCRNLCQGQALCISNCDLCAENTRIAGYSDRDIDRRSRFCRNRIRRYYRAGVRFAFDRDSACHCLDCNRVQIIVNKIFTVRRNRNGIVPCFLRRLECQHRNDTVSFSGTIQTVPNNADRVVVQFSRLCHCQSCKSLTCRNLCQGQALCISNCDLCAENTRIAGYSDRDIDRRSRFCRNRIRRYYWSCSRCVYWHAEQNCQCT